MGRLFLFMTSIKQSILHLFIRFKQFIISFKALIAFLLRLFSELALCNSYTNHNTLSLMMKFTSALLALFWCGFASAQSYNVTFQVDMSLQTVGPNGVHIAGNLQAAAGFPGDWNPATTALTDANLDDIYEVTVSIPAGSYEYKFINGNAWGQDESMPSACGVSGTNRGITISGDSLLAVPCYGQCGPCPTVFNSVTFSVDMNNSTVGVNGVHVAGSWQALAGFPSDWDPATAELTDPDMDGIYTLVVSLPDGAYEYKYINGNAWGSDEGAIPAACNTNNNRALMVSGVTLLPNYCFNTCDIGCTAVVNYFVQFRVDMSSQCSFDSVDVAGSFNNYIGSQKLTAGTGANAGYYIRTLQVSNGPATYKFRKWDNGTVVWEGIADRSTTIVNNTTLPVACFNSTSACVPPPAVGNFQFTIDMTGQTIDTSGVWLIGDFTSPAWQAAAVKLTNNAGSNEYSAMINAICASNLSFKFVNGNPNGPSFLEESFTLADTACVTANGVGNFNRYYTRMGGDEMLSFVWEGCVSDAIPEVSGVTKVSSPKQYNVTFTTPASGDLYVLQTKTSADSVWKTPKSWNNPITSTQNFSAKVPGLDNDVRIGARISGTWYYSDAFTFSADCKPMTATAIELVTPFCVGDSAQLKAIANGGYKSKSFLWNTGETTRFIYGQQGQTYSVVATDEAGCADSASVTASSITSTYTPNNFVLAKPNATTFVGTWTAPSLGTGVSILGYRMQYRQVNVGASWISTPLSSSTTATIDLTGSCLPSANYEFTVFARFNDNGATSNGQVACRERKFYNGSGGCAKTDNTNGGTELNASLIVYPNPTNNRIYVQVIEENSVLELLDLSGKRMLSKVVQNAGETELDLSELSNGVYMLQVESSKGVSQMRIVKN